MGSCCVKQELTEEDIHFLKKHTRYDEETIREWYAGFLQVKCNGFEQKYKAVRTRTRKIFFCAANIEELLATKHESGANYIFSFNKFSIVRRILVKK